jgi:hypothetical protein
MLTRWENIVQNILLLWKEDITKMSLRETGSQRQEINTTCSGISSMNNWALSSHCELIETT